MNTTWMSPSAQCRCHQSAIQIGAMSRKASAMATSHSRSSQRQRNLMLGILRQFGTFIS